MTDKMKTVRDYLIAGLTIIATFLVAVWEEIIRRFPIDNYSLFSLSMSLLLTFFLLIRFYANPQILQNLKSDKTFLLFLSLIILFLIFPFIQFLSI